MGVAGGPGTSGVLFYRVRDLGNKETRSCNVFHGPEVIQLRRDDTM